MTKTELIKEIDSATILQARKFRSCKAVEKQAICPNLKYRRQPVGVIKILQSYATNVAIYIPWPSTIIVLGSWSNTTWQHINKWIKEVNPYKVIYLTKTSNKCVVKYHNYADSIYWTTTQWDKELAEDFTSLLQSLQIIKG